MNEPLLVFRGIEKSFAGSQIWICFCILKIVFCYLVKMEQEKVLCSKSLLVLKHQSRQKLNIPVSLTAGKL